MASAPTSKAVTAHRDARAVPAMEGALSDIVALYWNTAVGTADFALRERMAGLRETQIVFGSTPASFAAADPDPRWRWR